MNGQASSIKVAWMSHNFISLYDLDVYVWYRVYIYIWSYIYIIIVLCLWPVFANFTINGEPYNLWPIDLTGGFFEPGVEAPGRFVACKSRLLMVLSWHHWHLPGRNKNCHSWGLKHDTFSSNSRIPKLLLSSGSSNMIITQSFQVKGDRWSMSFQWEMDSKEPSITKWLHGPIPLQTTEPACWIMLGHPISWVFSI